MKETNHLLYAVLLRKKKKNYWKFIFYSFLLNGGGKNHPPSFVNWEIMIRIGGHDFIIHHDTRIRVNNWRLKLN